jgi:hypothetical protein
VLAECVNILLNKNNFIKKIKEEENKEENCKIF